MKYPVCKLADIINPGKYCVVSTDKEHVEEIRNLEENMRKEMHSVDTFNCHLSFQMYVAVEDSTGQLKRGIIEKKLRHDLYQVLLMDYGEILQVEKSNIKAITNKSFIEVEPLAFIVRLYGLIPTKTVYWDGTRKPRASKGWLPDSYKFVQNFFKEDQRVIVQSILIQQRTIYGDLFVKTGQNKKLISLRKLLCKNEFCVYTESNFIRLEGLNSRFSESSKELETKMQRVEKWQRENFGNGQNDIYTLPISVSTLSLRTTDTSSSSHSVGNLSSSNNHAGIDNNPKSSYEKLKRLGAGRGKLRLLAEEMKNKERLTVEELESGSSREIDVEAEKEIRVFEDCVHRVPSKMERAVAKLDEFPELCDFNEPTDVSLSITRSSSFSLVRNVKSVKEESVQGSESSKFPIKFTEEEREKNSSSNKSETTVESFGSNENYSFSKNIQLWKESLGPIKSGGCFSPYVVFDDTVVEPANTFRELPIQPKIIENLERGGAFRHLSQIQRWAIPAIRKQHNTVIIGSSKTGKTLSYIVPLIDYVQDFTYFEELPPGNGPSVVIVASSSCVSESIYYMCHSLLGNFTENRVKKCKVKIVLAHGNGYEKEAWVSLTNGCDILISTPHCLVRLLESPIITNFERLTCLVFDEIDIISQNPFRKSVRIILEKAKFATKDRHYQSILVGERWTQNVESLVKTYIQSYALIIGSSLEAVIFEKLKPNIHLVDRQHKAETLVNLLKDRRNKSKILVICEKDAEASRLKDFLDERKISSLLAHEKMIADRLREIQIIWKSSTNSLLVATDGVLNELNIREVQTLIHFELPSKSKTNFYLRFTTLEGFLRDAHSFLKNRTKDLNLQSIILVDDENHCQLPHIIDFVTRLGGKIPSKILGKCEEIYRVIELEKSSTPFCRKLLSFGRCRNSKECPSRHVFIKALDSPTDLPTSGWVNFVVLKTHDASCFSVKILEHTDLEGNSFKMEDRRPELSAKVSKFFKSANNQRVLGKVKCGDICAVKEDVENKEVFYRAKVIEVLKTDKYEKPLEVKVKLIDEGDIWKRKTTQLFELPDDLSTDPPTAVDVYIVGIQPMDFDLAWSAIANDFVSNLMTQKLHSNQYWSGKIVLALNNTLFLNPIKRKEYLPLLKTHVFDLVVQGELLNKRIAMANNEHLPALLKLCSTSDIDVPKKGERKKKDVDVVQPQWAFFDSDFIRVTFLAAENTSTVFLQPNKFEKVLQDLEEDCQKEAAEVRNNKQKKSKSNVVTVGMFCLALFEDGKWNRGRVDSETETQFFVFFIDHGDFLFISKSDVIPISQTLLLRLPCQAIECSLVGIHPEEEECPVEVLQEIYSFSKDGEEYLYAYIIEKNLKPSVTNGRKYKVNLLNEKGISLNKMLVDKGLVQAEEAEKKHLEDIEVEGSDEDEAPLEEEDNKSGEKCSGDESWERLFNNLTDDVFEDAEALEFLKEFASKFLSFNFEKTKAIEPPKVETQSQPQKTSEVQITKEVQPKTQKQPERKLKLKIREKVLTPQVLWCQNQLQVEIKILLGNVKDYCLECTVQNVSFRCFLKEKFYAVDFKLFGPISPQMTKVTVKAFHVVVVLTKLAFPLWPRLHADDEKHRWINLDVESFVDRDGPFCDKIESAQLAIESGMIKKGVRSDNIKAYSDSEEEEAVGVDSYSEDSEDFD